LQQADPTTAYGDLEALNVEIGPFFADNCEDFCRRWREWKDRPAVGNPFYLG
jgi:hypothetical protein